jgi:outer membrane protein TolC
VGKLGNSFPPDNNRWSVGITISFPFFPGTSTIYGTKSADALRDQAELNTASTDNKLIAALQQAYNNLQDAIANLRVAEEFARAAKARSTIATEKYNTGLMSFEDWTVIETDQVNRDQTLLLNSRNAMQAEASWENALGKGAIP